MDAAATLAHRADRDLPEDFDAYWSEMREAVASLPASWRGHLDGPINEVVFESVRAVRVVAQLSIPKGCTPGDLPGAVVTTHGYAAADQFPADVEPWTERGLATMRIRVRGYPPSTLDIADLRDSWITHNIEDADAWILRGAVADVMQAYRCLRRRFGADLPINLHGESFGAGLAVMAAAQLTLMGDPPHRMAIGLPSLGDWRWRRDHYCNGSGGQVNAVLDALREHGNDVLERMRLLDACLHARHVTCPSLVKLAERDDVVPAPSAAAVFNALASSARWRFVVAYGHFDGGMTDLRRHARFERAQAAFLDPRADPEAIAQEIDTEYFSA